MRTHCCFWLFKIICVIPFHSVSRTVLCVTSSNLRLGLLDTQRVTLVDVFYIILLWETTGLNLIRLSLWYLLEKDWKKSLCFTSRKIAAAFKLISCKGLREGTLKISSWPLSCQNGVHEKDTWSIAQAGRTSDTLSHQTLIPSSRKNPIPPRSQISSCLFLFPCHFPTCSCHSWTFSEPLEQLLARKLLNRCVHKLATLFKVQLVLIRAL